MIPFRPFLTMAASLAAVALLASSCSLFGGDDEASEGTDDDGDSTEATGDAPAAPVAGAFNVIGKDIIDPEGNLFVPFGANVGPPLKDTNGKPIWYHTLKGDDITTPQSQAAIETWGWNALRTNTLCVPTDPNPEIGSSGHGNAEVFAALDAVVNTYTPKGIVVMIDCHDFTASPVEVGSPEWESVQAFWVEANDRYGDNGYVWFNHLNEAHLPDQGEAVWQAQVDGAYDAFVEMESKNLLVFDIANQGQKLEAFQDPAIQEWAKTKCNVVWGWHSYGAVQTGAEDLRFPDQAEYNVEATKVVDEVAAAEIPLVVGEFGYDWNSDRQKSNFSYQAERVGTLHAIDTAPKHGYGMIAWHANGDSGEQMTYGLKNSDSQTFAQPAAGENLSEFGTAFWEYSQNQSGVAAQAGPTGEACTR